MMNVWGMTDVGLTRRENQDAYAVHTDPDSGFTIGVVCDGMGGAKSGNVASTLAVDVFSQEIQRTWTPTMEWDKTDQLMKNAVKLANFTVYDQAKQFEEFDGMGTTLVAAFVRGRKVSFVNVGDSRAYIINQKGIRQITKDHSVVQMMVDRGELTPEMAKSYPGKNLITRAVGTEPVVVCDIYRQELNKGDFLLLCSDGLSNLLDDQEILFEVVHGVNKERCCKRLLDIAISRGSPDNVTCVLVSL